MKRRRFWSMAGVAGVVAAVAFLVLPAMGEGPVLGEVGVLRLHLDADGDKFIYNAADSDTDLIQNLTASNCKISSNGASLVQLSATGSHSSKKPFPGLKDHRIGVGQQGEGTGEPCARINKDLSQTLKLSLTGDLTGQSVGYAEIDLGFKYNGEAILELRKGNTLVKTVTVLCKGGSDCGPDSGKSDNERVVLWFAPSDNPGVGHWQAFQIPGVFDNITIKPSGSSKAAVSVEGGFNGALPGPLGAALGTDDTLFKLVSPFEGEIDCTEAESLGDDHVTLDITRGFDTDGGCKGPPDGLLFNFESGIEEDGELFVDFVVAPVNGESSAQAQFLEVITWTFADPPDVPGGADQHGTLFYDDPDVEGFPPILRQVMPWCISDPRDGSGSLPADPVTIPAQVLPPGHTSCLIESNHRVVGMFDSTFVTVDVVYNVADGKRWRG
jgi:hypothetical protein